MELDSEGAFFVFIRDIGLQFSFAGGCLVFGVCSELEKRRRQGNHSSD